MQPATKAQRTACPRMPISLPSALYATWQESRYSITHHDKACCESCDRAQGFEGSLVHSVAPPLGLLAIRTCNWRCDNLRCLKLEADSRCTNAIFIFLLASDPLPTRVGGWVFGTKNGLGETCLLADNQCRQNLESTATAVVNLPCRNGSIVFRCLTTAWGQTVIRGQPTAVGGWLTVVGGGMP